ncbi:MAG: hypothetical protein ACKO9D_08090, partial [Gammaproteobacteria bacterium]
MALAAPLLAALAGCAESTTPDVVPTASAAAVAGPAAPGTLRIATWNMEWLIAPNAFRKLAAECVPEGASPGPRRRYISCDVAERERSEADFRAIARY